MKILLAWLGMTDINAALGKIEGLGPIGQAIDSGDYDQLFILSDQAKKIDKSYRDWLTKQADIDISFKKIELTSPTSFSEIYEAATSLIEEVQEAYRDAMLTYHLSPGTPAMASVWIILAKTKYSAELIESSIQAGVKTVSIPFDLSADYLPELAVRDSEIARLTQGLPPQTAEFDNIVHKGEAMKRVIARARRVAIHDVPVLIQGETGTGKELLARAIHSNSSRKKQPFIPVNCGAIPDNLFEAEFFGYTRGAFTGAKKDTPGYIEAANNGTLFLDEIGELPLSAQVKLLRVLQENKLSKLGETKEVEIDVRIIAATNRNLVQEISEKRFRSDLFHRIAVGMLHLPALRDRAGDLSFLIDSALAEVNKSSKDKLLDWKDKKLSASAKNFMLNHTWPGNVRELYNTISRAVLWSPDETIHGKDMFDAILQLDDLASGENGILDKPIEDGIELENIMEVVATEYIQKALKRTNNNKTKAAELLGFASYQTLTNWMKRYNIK